MINMYSILTWFYRRKSSILLWRDPV